MLAPIHQFFWFGAGADKFTIDDIPVIPIFTLGTGFVS
jgi:hypothetical protein